MNLKDYISELEIIRLKYGEDLEVETYGFMGRSSAPMPKIAYRKKLNPRESKSRFWSTYDGEQKKGEMVVNV